MRAKSRAKPRTQGLHVWTNDDRLLVVAYCLCDALAVLAEHRGDSLRQTMAAAADGTEWTCLPDDAEIVLAFENEGDGEEQTRTCVEWARRWGRGVIADEEW